MSAPRAHVAVRATARREVAPDSYQVTVRVACRAADATVAMTSLTTGFARVEEAIEALPGSDLTVARGEVSQRRVVVWQAEPQADARIEWLAGRQLTLTGRDIERAATVLGTFAGLIGSVDGLELDGPVWRLDGDNPAYGEVQADAVREALARAQRYAAALGGRLGPLIELADSGMPERPDFAAARAAARAAGPGEGVETMDFTPVPIEVTVSVDGRWALILP